MLKNDRFIITYNHDFWKPMKPKISRDVSKVLFYQRYMNSFWFFLNMSFSDRSAYVYTLDAFTPTNGELLQNEMIK